jgi:hypothetical protein
MDCDRIKQLNHIRMQRGREPANIEYDWISFVNGCADPLSNRNA